MPLAYSKGRIVQSIKMFEAMLIPFEKCNFHFFAEGNIYTEFQYKDKSEERRMKHSVVISAVIVVTALIGCTKQPDPVSGAHNEQAQNQYKKTIDTVKLKTQQANDHVASSINNADHQ
ncbi:hypothetical protein F975_01625 [Acinetobacter sp. ANC 3789]|nr:hypothetical protein F975_01625 [Acinetobacter sp. ANC 3789]